MDLLRRQGWVGSASMALVGATAERWRQGLTIVTIKVQRKVRRKRIQRIISYTKISPSVKTMLMLIGVDNFKEVKELSDTNAAGIPLCQSSISSAYKSIIKTLKPWKGIIFYNDRNPTSLFDLLSSRNVRTTCSPKQDNLPAVFHSQGIVGSRIDAETRVVDRGHQLTFHDSATSTIHLCRSGYRPAICF